MSETIPPASGDGSKTSPPVPKVYDRSELGELRRKIRRDRKDLRRQLRHQRQFLTILATMFALFSGGIGLLGGIIYYSNRTEIAQIYDRERAERDKFELNVKAERDKFEDNMKKQFIRNNEESVISLYYKDSAGVVRLMDGQELFGKIYRNIGDDGKQQSLWPWKIQFYYIIKNESDVTSGKWQEIVYHNEQSFGDIPSADDALNFKYEFISSGDGTSDWVEELPGRYGRTNSFIININVEKLPILKKIPILLRLFYGKGKSTQAKIYLSSVP